MTSLIRASVLFVFLFAVGWPIAGKGQEKLPPHVIGPRVAAGLSDTHVVDLTRDGNPDLLSASRSDDKIAWYKNNGESFSDQKVITRNFSIATSITSKDLDGDGVTDILSGSRFKVSWYKNDQNGRFSDQNNITNDVRGVRSVRASDLDDDGDADVIVASKGEGKITWYKNNGKGSFSQQEIVTKSVDNPQSIHIDDLNGDGTKDVLASLLGKEHIVWYSNKGSSFSDGQIITTEVNNPSDAYATDLDGDGDVDVLSASSADEKIAWYENTGNGSFSEQKIISSSADDAASVRSADLDLDGDPDILSLSQNKVVWYENTGGSTFSDPKEIATDMNASGKSLTVADLTGNGSPDVVSASRSGKIAWYQNLQGSFSAEKVIIEPYWPTSVFSADVTGDGRKDVLISSWRDDKIAWYRNQGGGAFSNQKVITTEADKARQVQAADLTKDGKKDVLSRFGKGIAWHKNQGNGSFSKQRMITTSGSYGAVYAADLDGNEGMGVLVAQRGISWYEFSKDSFVRRQTIAKNTEGLESVKAPDLNGDGRKDILFVSQRSGNVAWSKNQGNGSFSSKKIIDSTDRPVDVVTADLDGDGDLDVLVASKGGEGVIAYENLIGQDEADADGFGSALQISVGGNRKGAVTSLDVADLDRDGDTDVISGSNLGLAWHENENASFGLSFSSEIVAELRAQEPRDVFGAELDGDNDTDILTVLDLDVVAWHENTSGVLPVDLADFNARLTAKGGATLTWNTASEANNAGFEVQHYSPNSETWQNLGFVKSKARGGTTTETHTYQFTAKDLPVGTHHFRLKQVDLDGSSALHGPISVKVKMQEPVKLVAPAPNPVSASATLSFAVKEQSETTIALYNTLGQQVAMLYEGTPPAGERQTTQIDASGLPSGTYFIRLRAGENAKTKRMTVVR